MNNCEVFFKNIIMKKKLCAIICLTKCEKGVKLSTYHSKLLKDDSIKNYAKYNYNIYNVSIPPLKL